MSFSATARLVALGVHYEARAGRAASLPSVTRALAARAAPAVLHPLLAERLLRRLEAAWLPGIAAHYVARKAWFWESAQRIVEEGVQRVVVLAPGCDGLSLGLQKINPMLQICEFAHPREHAARRKLLAEAGGETVTIRSLDLGDSGAGRVLGDLAAEPIPTLWVAEAVLMYLSPSVAIRLCRLLHSAHASHHFLMSMMAPDARGLSFCRFLGRECSRLLARAVPMGIASGSLAPLARARRLQRARQQQRSADAALLRRRVDVLGTKELGKAATSFQALPSSRDTPSRDPDAAHFDRLSPSMSFAFNMSAPFSKTASVVRAHRVPATGCLMAAPAVWLRIRVSSARSLRICRRSGSGRHVRRAPGIPDAG